MDKEFHFYVANNILFDKIDSFKILICTLNIDSKISMHYRRVCMNIR